MKSRYVVVTTYLLFILLYLYIRLNFTTCFNSSRKPSKSLYLITLSFIRFAILHMISDFLISRITPVKVHIFARDAFLYCSSSVTSRNTLIISGNLISSSGLDNSISIIARSDQKGYTSISKY